MSEAKGKTIILRPGEGRSVDLGGFRMSVKANALSAAEPEEFE